MSTNLKANNGEEYRPKTDCELEGEEFEDKLDHVRGGKKKSVETSSHQSKPKSVR